MSRNIVKSKLDVIFKKLFTEHKDLLHDFISEMLDIPGRSLCWCGVRAALWVTA